MNLGTQVTTHIHWDKMVFCWVQYNLSNSICNIP